VKSIRKYLQWLTMLCAVMLVSGCVTTSGNYCDIAKPIWWDDAGQLDATPDGIVRQIVTHNQTWEAVCQ
jgi:hypothetical protein